MSKYLFHTISILFLTLLVNCQKPNDFRYVVPEAPHVNNKVNVKELIGANQLDILWVIDNSGSMGTHQKNVIANMDQFITALSSSSNLDWRSGLISTSQGEPPYAGFDSTSMLESRDPIVGARFKAAIRKLGIGGDSEEKMFQPIEDVLTKYPNFLRPNAGLAIIVISDAPEQSGPNFAADQFVQYIRKAKGNLDQVFFYGFLNPVDWCTPTDDTWKWAGSPFERVNKLMKGQIYKLCDPKFANNLTDLGRDLSREFLSSRIFLKDRPRVSSIQILHQGKKIQGGARDTGGFWTYRADLNAVEFSDLSFAPGTTEFVQLLYDIDDGIDRD